MNRQRPLHTTPIQDCETACKALQPIPEPMPQGQTFPPMHLTDMAPVSRDEAMGMLMDENILIRRMALTIVGLGNELDRAAEMPVYAPTIHDSARGRHGRD